MYTERKGLLDKKLWRKVMGEVERGRQGGGVLQGMHGKKKK